MVAKEAATGLMPRIIAHIDMDAFYAAVAKRELTWDGTAILRQHVVDAIAKQTPVGAVITKDARRPQHIDVLTAAILAHEAHRTLDQGILRALWLPYGELVARHDLHRSPLVLRCVDDYRAGLRRPLDLVTEM